MNKIFEDEEAYPKVSSLNLNQCRNRLVNSRIQVHDLKVRLGVNKSKTRDAYEEIESLRIKHTEKCDEVKFLKKQIYRIINNVSSSFELSSKVKEELDNENRTI